MQELEEGLGAALHANIFSNHAHFQTHFVQATPTIIMQAQSGRGQGQSLRAVLL